MIESRHFHMPLPQTQELMTRVIHPWSARYGMRRFLMILYTASLLPSSLSQTVSELRKTVSSHVKLSPFEIELIYAGRSLKDDVKMEQYGLKPGCTVHVLVKKYRDSAMITEPLHSEGEST